MLFSCVEDTRGCEWRNLKGLVQEYNLAYGTCYSHSECVDVRDRRNKSPEVLLESPGVRDMVIEHKLVSFDSGPGSYLHNHGKVHVFFSAVSSAVKNEALPVDDFHFVLRFRESSVWKWKAKALRKIAKEVGSQVVQRPNDAMSFEGVSSEHPFHWSLGLAMPHEVDDGGPYRGLSMNASASPWNLRDGSSWQERKLRTLRGYERQLATQALSASEKFERYQGYQRVMAIRFCGDYESGVEDKELVALIESATLPSAISQVWVAHHDWVSADDYEVGWRLVA